MQNRFKKKKKRYKTTTGESVVIACLARRDARWGLQNKSPSGLICFYLLSLLKIPSKCIILNIKNALLIHICLYIYININFSLRLFTFTDFLKKSLFNTVML